MTSPQINTGPEEKRTSWYPVTFFLCQSPADTQGTLAGAMLVIARDADEAAAVYKENEYTPPKRVYAITPSKGDWRVIGKVADDGKLQE